MDEKMKMDVLAGIVEKLLKELAESQLAGLSTRAKALYAELATVFDPPAVRPAVENYVTTPITPKPTVTGTVLDYFVDNRRLDDPLPFVVARPLPGFAATISRQGNPAEQYISGEPIRTGDVIAFETATPVAASMAPCAEFYYPDPRTGGQLALHSYPGMTRDCTRVAFTFKLAGNGRGTYILDYHNA